MWIWDIKSLVKYILIYDNIKIRLLEKSNRTLKKALTIALNVIITHSRKNELSKNEDVIVTHVQNTQQSKFNILKEHLDVSSS